MIRGTVAIVGRPNVGKSTIFNRLIGQRKSIVDDTPGVTRDRIYGEVEWLTQTFRLIDTGGIQIEDQAFAQEINMQVDIAIEEADVIIFLTSAKEGVMTDDTIIARKLQKCKKPVILACNKVDNPEMQMNVYEFYALGLGDPIAISGAHGIGLGDLLDVVMEKLPEKDIAPYEGITSFCCIGRPNVGKSSLVNSILKEDRVIVSNVEGTTRDAIDTPFFVDDKEYMYITNITDEITDVVYYDVCSGIIFLNGKPVAYVENAVSFPDEKSIESVSPLATTGWRYHDTSNHRISWARGVAAATLAGIIAAVIPSTGWLSVLTKIGATALSAVSAACIGGNVKCVAYTQVLASGKVQCRYDWTFRPSSGESYGPYSSYKL